MQRTRLALFSSLGERLDGMVFVDLFAGGGAVGIDALSRGAARVHFVESDAAAARALRANLDMLSAAPARYIVHARRVADVVDSEPCPLAGAHVVFADPPYDLDVNAELLQRWRSSRFSELRRLVVEHRTGADLMTPAGLRMARERRFGDTMLTTFVPDDR